MSQNDVIKKTLPFIGFKGFLCLKKVDHNNYFFLNLNNICGKFVNE